MQVLKFGGSSVSNASNIQKVIDIVNAAINRDKTILVCSAISGCTDKLIEISRLAEKGDESYKKQLKELQKRHLGIIRELFAHDDTRDITAETDELFSQIRDICNGVYLIRELSRRSADAISGYGELLSTRIISAKFTSLGIKNTWFDSRQIIKTEKDPHSHHVNTADTYENISSALHGTPCKLLIFPGFIASDENGNTTTLGRGGSDYTAAILAAGSHARVLEIWTDVSGMKNADPRIVPEAETIPHISYREALELSHFGAKVIYPPTLEPVIRYGIPVYVKNTFRPEDAGTLIERNPPEGTDNVKGIGSSDRIALLSVEGSGMVGVPGYSAKLFDTLAKEGIDIILITQASSLHTMCIAIAENEAEKAKKAADNAFAYEIQLGKVEPVKVEYGFSILSIVGDDMKNQAGACSKLFDALAERGINIRATAQGSSEKNISAIVSTKDIGEAVRAAHEEYFGKSKNRINIFIAGIGTVGSALVKIISERSEYIFGKTGRKPVLCGIANSRGFIIDKENGIRITDRPASLIKPSEGQYIDRICALKVKNGVFVDCTSSKEIALSYPQLFEAGISVVTCNKIAGSSNLTAYRNMMDSAVRNKQFFGYETTVGASLPLIAALKQIINSGDEIESFEAVVSGTLNYIFSEYSATRPFADIIKDASEKGYSEPDPRTDLSGTDVLRKATILARETGLDLNMEDISFKPILPEHFYTGTLEQFYDRIAANEEEFRKLYTESAEKEEKLKFIVKYGNGKISVGLESIGKGHPFYNLNGTNNALVIKSKFYPNLVKIEGAGAGDVQTAMGLFYEILNAKGEWSARP